jgi:short-subunit dehydrogenase
MFEVNAFELTGMVQAGLRGMPALGQHNATQLAVEGLSEALRLEVEPLGIQVRLVEPSGFRTDWAGRSDNESKQQIDNHSATAGKVRAAGRAAIPPAAGQRRLRRRHGQAR